MDTTINFEIEPQHNDVHVNVPNSESLLSDPQASAKTIAALYSALIQLCGNKPANALHKADAFVLPITVSQQSTCASIVIDQSEAWHTLTSPQQVTVLRAISVFLEHFMLTLLRYIKREEVNDRGDSEHHH